MTDIGEQTEVYAEGWHDGFESRDAHIGELCAEIERLRTEVEHLRTTLGYLADNIDNPALVAVAEAPLKPKP